MFNLYLTGGDALLYIILSASFVVALNKVCNEAHYIHLIFKYTSIDLNPLLLHPKNKPIKNLRTIPSLIVIILVACG